MSEEKDKKIFPGGKGNSKEGKPGKPKISPYWIYAIIAVAILLIQLVFSGGGAEKVESWQEIESMVRNRDIRKITVVNGNHANIFLTGEALNSSRYQEISDKTALLASGGPHYVYNISTVELFEEKLAKVQEDAGYSESEIIHPSYETKSNAFGEILSWIIPLLFFLVIWVFLFRRMAGGGSGGAGGIFSVGKSKAQIFDKDNHVKVDFKDVAGLEEAKTEVIEIVDFLKNPQKYTELGGKIPKGALLVGPPGTGKTLLAKAVAGEANVPFFSISGSDFVEMFVGVGASRVRDLFKQAKEKAPCIVFIDEIDAVGRARGRNSGFGGNDERENTLNQLLTEMDGFASNQGVIILAATNRADVLDRALLRAGRFDRQIHLELPDLKERREIFKVHLRPLRLEKNFDVAFMAKQTPGFSGADIANVCNEAALIAARRNKKAVDKQDFLDAVDRIIGGLEKKSKIISPEEKRTIAYHEAGHATLSWLLQHASPLLKVTIIPRGKALGAAWYLPEERQLSSVEQMMDEITATLGGRASEDIIFGRVTTGALNDLERVTKQAYAMVSYFGMSSIIGNLSYFDSTGQQEYSFNKPYSDKTAETIDEETKRIVDDAYARAKSILIENRDGLSKLAEKLLEKEVIFSENMEAIFGKRKWANPLEEKENEGKKEEKLKKRKEKEEKEETGNRKKGTNKEEKGAPEKEPKKGNGKKKEDVKGEEDSKANEEGEGEK